MGKFQLTKSHLDPLLKCQDTNDFYSELKSKVIGQDEALEKAANIIQTYKAGFHQKGRPISINMYLGPTGTGKTLTVESIAECLFGNNKAFFKLDCGEFQNNSSVSTLLGSPPGYLGFKQSEPYISQEKLDKYQTKEYPINLLLLDEVEKAHEAIQQLFLGVLDKGILKTNTGEEIDFSNTIIFMTSNIGAEEINDLDKSSLGFDSNKPKKLSTQAKKSAVKAMEKFFKQEFVNRIDNVIVFNTLTSESINKICKLELKAVASRIFLAKSANKFTFLCTREVERHIIDTGFNIKYGARELKRVISKIITDPLASLMMSNQVSFGDLILVSMQKNLVKYDRINSEDIYNLSVEDWAEYKEELQLMENDNDVLVAGASQSL